MFCMKIDQEDEDLLCYKSKMTTDGQQISHNMESVDQTKKTILKNVTTTKVVKSNKEELSNLKSIRQVFQDSQRLDESSANRTPKRLLFSSSRANEYPNAKSKRKAEIKFIKSSKLKRSTKAKAKSKDINKKEKQDEVAKSSSLYLFALEDTDRDYSDFTIYQAPVKQSSALHGNEELIGICNLSENESTKGKNQFSSKRKAKKIIKKTRNKLKFECDLHEADHTQNLNHFKKDFIKVKDYGIQDNQNNKATAVFPNPVCGNRCLECDSTGICISCIDGMYLLNGVCYFCPDGQYFDKTANSCLDCGTNCNGLCSYRTDCFKCSGSQSFSLLQMKCVDSCSTGEVTIQSDDIHGLKVCRSLNYFVHPSSESILELGTRENPYKNINLSCFNFIDASSQSVSIRLSLGDAHILAFGTVGIINQFNATIQPFNEIATVSTNLSYSSTSRSTILFQDYDIPYTSTTTMFNLLSNFRMNQSVINSLTYDVQKLIKLPQIGFFISNSDVLFKNIRFEDDYMYIQNQKAIWFAPTKLESKVFNLTNVDIKCTSTILSCSDPIGFAAKNINIIDYINLESGFSFVTQCNYIGATTVGSISIDSVYFTKESADLGQYVTGSLIDIQSPFNISITNSNFVLQNSIQEGFDVIVIKDNGVCSPYDSVVQNIVFSNNTLTLDTSTQDVFINMVISFTNSNKRTKYITILNNTFYNIIGASVSILEINYYSSGTVLLTNNTFRNCSTAANMLAINANDNITINGLKFDSCIITSSGLATLGTAANIGVNTLTVIGTSYTSALHSASLIELSTSTDGTLLCNGFSFSNNSININAIKIDSTVGLLSMQNSLFANEMAFTSDPYITIVNIYDANIFNISFTNMYSYTTDYETPRLVSLGNIQISKTGNIILDSIQIANSSLSFITIDSISGSDTYAKNVIFKNINITDCVFTTRNELISIGPILTSSQFSVSMTNVVFNNLTFENYAKVIHVNIQSGTPFVIANCSFTNIYGGSIVLESVSTSSGTNKTNLVVQNITVDDNDFATSTLFVLKNYCILNVTDCTMKRNSGYFYGTIASILGDSSSAFFSNCNFNNNNGVNGGLFYVASQSSISLSNCLLFSNFAINAAIAYIENLGSMNIDNCDISFNMAMFAGIIGILDSVTPTTLTNSKIYSNTVVSYSTMIADIDNPKICINLCFASDGYKLSKKLKYNNIILVLNILTASLDFWLTNRKADLHPSLSTLHRQS